MDITKIKLPIAVIGIIVAQAFGIIWYVATLDSTVNNLDIAVAEMQASMTNTSIAVLETDLENLKITVDQIEIPEVDLDDVWESIEDFDDRLDDIEKQQAIIENEMRSIMADHQGFNKVLEDLGKGGYADTREYGNYDY
jgi:septal ring factor EnvC (AmiA/AmiB activator)